MSLGDSQVYDPLKVSTESVVIGSHAGINQESVYGKEEVLLEPPFKEGTLGREQDPIAVLDNPLFVYDPGRPLSSTRVRSMASAGDGGDKGGTDEATTHPKSLGSGAIVPVRSQGRPAVAEVQGESNWHAGDNEGMEGTEAMLAGGVDMEDDIFVEEEPEEEPVATPARWRLLGRYINQRRPNIDDMTDQFSAVWKVRSGLNIAALGKNWFVVTLFSAGDFEFVGRGGPWIYKGNVLLVAPFNGEARPSELVLNVVLLWVRIYDIPWDKQNAGYGRYLGGLLGVVREVDLEADGSQLGEFIRVRVELPLDRRLQTEIKIGKAVDGKPKKKYVLRYERVPHYCFWCGFIGHDDSECEKKHLGVPSRTYDDRLRCSPFRKFERRSSFAPPPSVHPGVHRGLDFTNSSNSSSNLGQASDGRRNRRRQQAGSVHITERVDARDGFDMQEGTTAQGVDSELANRVLAMRVHLAGEQPSSSRMPQGRGMPYVGQHRPRDTPVASPLPISILPSIPAPSDSSSLGSSQMILALRGLNTFQASYGDSDTAMAEVDSVLGKRTALQKQEEKPAGNQNLITYSNEADGGAQKRGKLGVDQYVQDVVGGSVPMDGLEELEATSHGAASKLTEPNVAPRQQQ